MYIYKYKGEQICIDCFDEKERNRSKLYRENNKDKFIT